MKSDSLRVMVLIWGGNRITYFIAPHPTPIESGFLVKTPPVLQK